MHLTLGQFQHSRACCIPNTLSVADSLRDKRHFSVFYVPKISRSVRRQGALQKYTEKYPKSQCTEDSGQTCFKKSLKQT